MVLLPRQMTQQTNHRNAVMARQMAEATSTPSTTMYVQTAKAIFTLSLMATPPETAVPLRFSLVPYELPSSFIRSGNLHTVRQNLILYS